MKEQVKPWKKSIAVITMTDFSKNLPVVSEWVSSISTYDENEYVMIVKEFDEAGKLIEVCTYYENEFQIINYDSSCLKIYDERIKLTENEQGDSIYLSANPVGNMSQEKLEYDSKGRCIKKIFVEKKREDSCLEFEYDTNNIVILTRNFEEGKLEFFEEEIFVSNIETIKNKFNSRGQIISKTEYKRLDDRNYYINFYYDGECKLIKRIDEICNDKNEVLEQRIYDRNDSMIYQIIFGDKDKFGFRTKLIENFYKSNKLYQTKTTNFIYEY